MTSSFSAERYSQLLDQLNAAMAQRAEAERRLAALKSDEGNQPFDPTALQESLSQLEAQLQTDQADAAQLHADALADLEARFRLETATAESEHRQEKSRAEDRIDRETQQVESQYDENRWILTSLVDETADNNPKRQLELFKTQLERLGERLALEWEELQQLSERAVALVNDRRHGRDEEPLTLNAPPGTNRDAAQTRFDEAAFEARTAFGRLENQVLPRLLAGTRILLIGLCLWLPAFGALALFVDPAAIGLQNLSQVAWMLISAGATFAVCALVLLILGSMAARQTWEAFQPFREGVADAQQNYKQWRKFAKAELKRTEDLHQQRYEALVNHREGSLNRFTTERDQKLQTLTRERQEKVRALDAERQTRLQAAQETFAQEQAATQSAFQHQRDQIQAAFDQERHRLTSLLEQQRLEQERQLQEGRRQMADAWNAGLQIVQQETETLNEQSRLQYPTWPEILDPAWQPPTEIPSGIRIGSYQVDLTQWPKGTVLEGEEVPNAPTFALPAVLPFPHSPSFVLKTASAGRGDSVAIQQTALLRLLTQLPPGTVRLTICDPVGLGEPFAAFMHLADFDELLITNRIWTESAHVEEQLAKLTEHLENVFQKYLRNEFDTIEEYNRQAGEVAEPYRILVVAGFPSGFSERAAHRLTSIASSGPRCGVYLLMSVDTRQQMPRGFQLADVEANATVLHWEQGHFVTEEFGNPALAMIPDQPPNSADFTNLVRKVGELSRSIRRVEVPFHRIAPPEDRYWTADSRRVIDVALGRSGATKLQHLQLGLGTSQHVLVAGKTGSGKSTLLHVLITNLALNYSPAEIEFYLIDFKKGVEFKAYANLNLPHARVIAIESDREFGLSVLERLDGILKERGELFREQGVQDIGSFRNAQPEAVLPRILLVVDEFQEFFTEDDRVFQTAALLLDRLVRQGRAFGIHVLLGSQTLGGAYSLARTTISQMAVRIALQCSETDAHLILSETNTAARLLTRPGEALYNDANGMLEGNSLFQISWLGDEERERLLAPLKQMAETKQLPAGPMIVFEGNLPADPARNAALTKAISEPEASATGAWRGAASSLMRGWIGEPVSITRSTAVSFRPQPGSHLLIVGTDLPATTGLISTCLVGLAAQLPLLEEEDAQPLAYLFNGHAGEPSIDRDWQRLADAVPHRIEQVPLNAVGTTITKLREEITRRQEQPSAAHRPVFVVVFDLSRFRELAKSDDDFGLGGFGREKIISPAQQFAELLKDGPAVGLHVLLWCNSFNTVERGLGRQLLREFEMRVAFQMSAGDSSNLIDNPAGSRLGPNRALLYRDDEGTTEKFRPYGRPSDAWLAWVKDQLAGPGASPALEIEEIEIAEDISDWTIQ